jgi:proteasome accessory factor PafA2
MALPKICGIETEYGIVSRGMELSPMLASALLVSSYSGGVSIKIGWDFFDESPHIDARGAVQGTSIFPEVETAMPNMVLTNGARYYVDHAHPEVSTPECRRPSEIVLFDRAAEEIIRDSMANAAATMGNGAELIAYKNNSDGKGNSYGCHENYLIDRTIQFEKVAKYIVSHFITRQVFTGAGKVGVEAQREGELPVAFQISQRSDFFEEFMGLETTLKRPLVNTRDEPHADNKKYRRLHVIVGDANMSEVATFLKVGTTALILSLIEDDWYPNEWQILDPVDQGRFISHDATMNHKVTLAEGDKVTALDFQEMLWERVRAYLDSGVADPTGGDAELIMSRWEQVVTGLRNDPQSVSHVVDWVAKKNLIDAYANRHKLSPFDLKLKAIDLQYHDMRAEKCLALRVGLETFVDQADVRRAMTEPPESTRAYFRGRCVSKWPNEIVAANWDSVVFDIGEPTLKRVPMMEPLKGTKDIVGDLLDSVDSASDLLHHLQDVESTHASPDPGW